MGAVHLFYYLVIEALHYRNAAFKNTFIKKLLGSSRLECPEDIPCAEVYPHRLLYSIFDHLFPVKLRKYIAF